MDPPLLVALGFLLAFAVVVLPRWRDRYEERYEDEREFFREQRPRLWGLVGGVAGDEEPAGDEGAHPPGRCPSCGIDNDVEFKYCRRCESRLPEWED